MVSDARFEAVCAPARLNLTSLTSCGRPPACSSYRRALSSRNESETVVGDPQCLLPCTGVPADLAGRVASALQQVGLQPGDRLGIYSANNVEWTLTAKAADMLSVIVGGCPQACFLPEAGSCLL